jgi:hypothetical protein
MDARERLLRAECNGLAEAISRERTAACEARLAAEQSRRDLDELHAAIDAAHSRMSAVMASAFLGEPPLTRATVRAAKVMIEAPHAETSQAPAVKPNGMPDPDGRIAELAAAERAISDALPEDDGYVSGWEVSAVSPSKKFHYEWRTARRSYVATGSDDDLASMLAYVTHDNPPLRSDSATRHAR